MVILLHDTNDQLAGADMARLHDTRTLLSAVMTERGTERRVVRDLLAANTQVVVPDAPTRITDSMLLVMRVLELLRFPTTTVGDYLLQLSQPAGEVAAPPSLRSTPVGQLIAHR